jgi:hypothetical protein
MKIGLRINKRIFATVIGIAICAAYLVGTISLVEGLHVGADNLSSNFNQYPYLVYTNGTVTESHVSNSTLEFLSEEKVARCVIANITHEGIETYILSIEDPYKIVSSIPVLEGDEILVGRELEIEEKRLLLTRTPSSQNLSIKGVYNSDFLPDNWIIMPKSRLWVLAPELEYQYSFIFIETSEEVMEELDDMGYTTVQLANIGEFFSSSISDIETSLWWIVFASSIIIVLLVYNIMSIEVSYKVRDIKTLKLIGARKSHVLGLFLMQGVMISILGAILGLAFGTMVSNLVVSFTPLFGYTSFVEPQATQMSIILPIILSMITGLVGAMLPAYRAAQVDIRRK